MFSDVCVVLMDFFLNMNIYTSLALSKDYEFVKTKNLVYMTKSAKAMIRLGEIGRNGVLCGRNGDNKMNFPGL